MNRHLQSARIIFATGMISLGILGLVYGDFALQWQPVPLSVPWREELAYASAVISLATGLALLWRRTAPVAARILLPYLLIWLLLRARGIVAAPLMEATWLGFGEIAVLAAGGWVLFASLSELQEGSMLKGITGATGIRIAQIMFAVCLIPVGLSHFVYLAQTVELVPAWLPFRDGWAYLTGAGHIAAGLGVLLSIHSRLAAILEAAMLTVITFLVWIPAVVATPTLRLNWTALLISWAIAAGAWVVALSFADFTSSDTV